jgi:uncharacterized phiE125 gp8 family phage protein
VRYMIRTIAGEAPTPLAVSVDEAKAYMKVTASAEDGTIAGLLRQAQEMVEDFTGEVLSQRELEMITCGFPLLPELISLPRHPVTEILSIAYDDPSTGAEVSLVEADWRWTDSAPDQLQPAWRQTWPVAAEAMGSVRIRMMAGYEAGLCPARLSGAVKTTTLQLYDGRNSGGCLSQEVAEGLVKFRPRLA